MVPLYLDGIKIVYSIRGIKANVKEGFLPLQKYMLHLPWREPWGKTSCDEACRDAEGALK